MDTYDVVVVGAGPVGSHAARLLALEGHSVLMVEEHPRVGQPIQCAGLVTPRTFDHTPFPPEEVHQNDLHGATIHSPNGTAVSFRTETVQAIAMDRADFDVRMAAAATRAGVELRTACKAVGITTSLTGATVELLAEGHRETVQCKLIIGADGTRSNIARWSGLPPVQEIVSAYEAELEGCTVPDAAMIPMFSGHAQAPGFFSWIIPVGGNKTRSGLAVAPGMNENAAKRYYERMFEDPLSRPYLGSAHEDHLIIGGIPLGLRKRLVADRVAVVGDAAGMAKPTSGGGIHTGLVAAEHLVKVVSPLIARDDLSRGHMRPYERRVRSTIARELRKGEILRAVYKRFTDDDLNRLAELLDAPKPRAVIESIGDIDYPSKLVWPLFRSEPRLATLFARIMLRGSA